jgi:hypothetical protein
MEQSNNQNITMIAEDLYRQSLKNNRYPKIMGMSNRSFLCACRNDLGNIFEGIDKVKLFKAIESGEVWNIKGAGKKTIKEWCEWIVKNQ